MTGPRPYLDVDDPTCERAVVLEAMLTEMGIECEVHWDRSPWGVRIPLVNPHRPPWRGLDYSEVPHLFVLTEGKRDIHTDRTRPWILPELVWQWNLSLGGFAEDVDGVLDGFSGWLREWQDTGAVRDVQDVADVLRVLVPILRQGAGVEIPDRPDPDNQPPDREKR